MTFACGLDLLLIIPLVVLGVIATCIVVVVLLVISAVLIYIILEMISILLILGYVAAIPIVFFITCLFVPFVLAVGVPILGPLAFLLAPKITFFDYLFQCLCQCFSCIKSFLEKPACCSKDTTNIEVNVPTPKVRRR
jgi:hypothetical protein